MPNGTSWIDGKQMATGASIIALGHGSRTTLGSRRLALLSQLSSSEATQLIYVESLPWSALNRVKRFAGFLVKISLKLKLQRGEEDFCLSNSLVSHSLEMHRFSDCRSRWHKTSFLLGMWWEKALHLIHHLPLREKGRGQ